MDVTKEMVDAAVAKLHKPNDESSENFWLTVKSALESSLQSAWVDVDDQENKPKHGKTILIQPLRYQYPVVGFWTDMGEWYNKSTGDQINQPRYWMPIPEYRGE